MSEKEINMSEEGSDLEENKSAESMQSDVTSTSEDSEEEEEEFDNDEYEKMMAFIVEFWTAKQEPDTEKIDDLEKKTRWKLLQRIFTLLSSDFRNKRKLKKIEEQKGEVRFEKDAEKRGIEMRLPVKRGTKDKDRKDLKEYEKEFRQKLDEIDRFRELNSLLTEELKAATELIIHEKKVLDDHPKDRELEAVSNEVFNLQVKFKEIFAPPTTQIETKKGNIRKRIRDRLKEAAEANAQKSVENFKKTLLKKCVSTKQPVIKKRNTDKINKKRERLIFKKEIEQMKNITEEQLQTFQAKLEHLEKLKSEDSKVDELSKLEDLIIMNESLIKQVSITEEPTKENGSLKIQDNSTEEPLKVMELIQCENRKLKTVRDEMKAKVFGLVKSNENMKNNIKMLQVNKNKIRGTLNEKYEIIIGHEHVLEVLNTKRDKMKAKYASFLDFKDKTLVVAEHSKELQRKINEADDEIAALEAIMKAEEEFFNRIDEETKSIDVECHGLQEFLREGVEILADALTANILPSEEDSSIINILPNQNMGKNNVKSTNENAKNYQFYSQRDKKRNTFESYHGNVSDSNRKEGINENHNRLLDKNLKTSKLTNENLENRSITNSKLHHREPLKLNKPLEECKRDIDLIKTRRHNLIKFLMEILNFANEGKLQRVSVFEEIADKMLIWKKDII